MMNVERLRDTLEALRQEMGQTSLLDRLTQIQHGFQNEINNPGNQQAQMQVSQAYSNLRDDLAHSLSEELGPVWQRTVKELNLGYLLPDELWLEVEKIFQDNQLTPAAALKSIRDLRNKVEKGDQAIVQLLTALGALGIRGAAIPPGKAEVGMVIPREAISDRLDEFGDETKGLSYWLNILSETATGEQEQATIESVSSSDLIIYVYLSTFAVRVVAKALKDIATAFKITQEGRLLAIKARDLGMTDREVAPIKAYVTKQMQKQISKTAKELLKDYPGEDDRRKNELKNAVPFVLLEIAKRFDAGYTFDVDIPDNRADDDEAPDDDAAAIWDARRTLKYMEPSNERVLELASGEEPDEPDESVQQNEPPSRGGRQRNPGGGGTAEES